MTNQRLSAQLREKLPHNPPRDAPEIVRVINPHFLTRSADGVTTESFTLSATPALFTCSPSNVIGFANETIGNLYGSYTYRVWFQETAPASADAPGFFIALGNTELVLPFQFDRCYIASHPLQRATVTIKVHSEPNPEGKSELRGSAASVGITGSVTATVSQTQTVNENAVTSVTNDGSVTSLGTITTTGYSRCVLYVSKFETDNSPTVWTANDTVHIVVNCHTSEDEIVCMYVLTTAGSEIGKDKLDSAAHGARVVFDAPAHATIGISVALAAGEGVAREYQFRSHLAEI